MSDFSLVKIPDERIAGCTDKLQMGVFSSGADVTKNNFNAISVSNSAISFNIPIGSQSLIVDRHITMEATCYWQLTITGIAKNHQALTIGDFDALQAFPLNSLFLTSSSQINNSNTSIQTQNIAPLILKMTDQYNLSKQNGGTPNYIDKYYYSFIDGTGETNNALGSYGSGGFGTEYVWGRGAFPITIMSIQHWVQAGGQDGADEPAFGEEDGEEGDNGENTSGTVSPNYPNARSYDSSLTSTGHDDVWVIKMASTFREPLIGLSPWLMEETPHNSAGIYGLSTLQFNFTIDQSLKRFWSTAQYELVTASPSQYSISAGHNIIGSDPNQTAYGLFGNTTSGVKMHITFLSPQPSDAINLPMKNIVPYQTYNQTITSVPKLASGVTATYTTNTITMSVVPDLVMVCVRKPMNSMTIADSNSFCTINNVVVQFSNRSGIFSSLGSYDLFEISKRNGLQEVSFLEWNGSVFGGAHGTQTANIATSGSLLVMNPVNWSLPDWICPGSAGQYTFSIIVTYTNNDSFAQPCEIAVTCIESGMLITESGQSALQIGVLSKDDCLDAKESHVIIPQDNFAEQSGGSLQAKIRTGIKHFQKFFHDKHNNKQDNREGQEESSGGAFSAGKRHGKLHKYIR